MLPFLAQGAGMALEDAVVLARCLTLITPVERALRRYEGARRLRTAKTQAWSRRNATLFHLPSTLAAGVFQSAAALDRLRRVDSRQRFDWLYGYDAANAVI
jgi:salicylate hydroxylase